MFIETVHAATLLPRFSDGQSLGEFINNIYLVAISVVGVAVFVQFVIAGFTYLLAAGNVGEIGSAKEKMQNAVLGAILLLGSYLILNTINPDLTRTNIFNLDEIAKGIPTAGPKISPSGGASVSPSPTK